MADFEFKAPTTGRSMVRAVLIGVVVLILVVVLVWAIVRHFQKEPTSEVPANLPETSQGEDSASGPTAPEDNAGTDGDASSDEGSSAGGSNEPTEDEEKAADHGEQLADTGPGDVVAVFVGAVLLGGLVFELHLRQRLSRSN